MVILIAGASHTGKTVLARKLLKEYLCPYLSIDHLKMGLIRSGNTNLTPEDDQQLTAYLWPIVREMVKTVIENRQDLIVEGCYIPFDWKRDFDKAYISHIRCVFLVMSAAYIQAHWEDILGHARDAEDRRDDSLFTKEIAVSENVANLEMCKKYGCEYILIEDEYKVDISAYNGTQA